MATDSITEYLTPLLSNAIAAVCGGAVVDEAKCGNLELVFASECPTPVINAIKPARQRKLQKANYCTTAIIRWVYSALKRGLEQPQNEAATLELPLSQQESKQEAHRKMRRHTMKTAATASLIQQVADKVVLAFNSQLRANANPPALEVTVSVAQNGYINFLVSQPDSSEKTAPFVKRHTACTKQAASDIWTQEISSIGLFESCFVEKHGTPRQGSVAPSSRGRLRLHDHISADSFQGLDQFSHVWLLFIFHHNTNKGFKSKVKPPRLKGSKVGAFATRTPHRPNPIGLSMARLIRIQGRTALLAGVDLIQGTPVVDIKPYHPADTVSPQQIKIPSWMSRLPPSALSVRFTPTAEAELRQVFQAKVAKVAGPETEPPLDFFESFDEVRDAIVETLAQDPRTLHSHRKHEGGLFGVGLDRLDVCFRVLSSASASPECEVFHIVHYAAKQPRVRLRTKAWLADMQELIALQDTDLPASKSPTHSPSPGQPRKKPRTQD